MYDEVNIDVIMNARINVPSRTNNGIYYYFIIIIIIIMNLSIKYDLAITASSWSSTRFTGMLNSIPRNVKL